MYNSAELNHSPYFDYSSKRKWRDEWRELKSSSNLIKEPNFTIISRLRYTMSIIVKQNPLRFGISSASSTKFFNFIQGRIKLTFIPRLIIYREEDELEDKLWTLRFKIAHAQSKIALTFGCHLSYCASKFFPIESSALCGATENGSTKNRTKQNHGTKKAYYYSTNS